jgi:hypothetical protein
MKRYVFLCLVMISYSLQAAVFSLHDGLTSSKGWLGGLAKVAECVVKSDGFLQEVAAFKKYDLTTDAPAQVAAKIKEAKTGLELSTYKPWYRYTKSIAYTVPGKSNTTYFNLYKNPRELTEMINTVIHEWLHILGYSHGTNSSRGKENTVNYRVGTIAEKWAKVCRCQLSKVCQ